jgi:hypothetical protein
MILFSRHVCVRHAENRRRHPTHDLYYPFAEYAQTRLAVLLPCVDAAYTALFTLPAFYVAPPLNLDVWKRCPVTKSNIAVNFSNSAIINDSKPPFAEPRRKLHS